MNESNGTEDLGSDEGGNSNVSPIRRSEKSKIEESSSEDDSSNQNEVYLARRKRIRRRRKLE